MQTCEEPEVSWEAMEWVRHNARAKGSSLAVLMMLALHADDDGFAWPSQETLARETRLSDRQVRRILSELEADRQIERAGINKSRTVSWRLVGPPPRTSTTSNPDTGYRRPWTSTSDMDPDMGVQAPWTSTSSSLDTDVQRPRTYTSDKRQGKNNNNQRNSKGLGSDHASSPVVEVDDDFNESGVPLIRVDLAKIGEPDRPPKQDPDVAKVFEAWLSSTERLPARTKLTPDRRRRIKKALASHGLDDCLAAVRHIGADAWARGDNDRGTRFDDIEHALGNSERIERWRDKKPRPHKTASLTEQQDELGARLLREKRLASSHGEFIDGTVVEGGE